MKFIIKKIVGLIITLLIVSMLAFLAFDVLPGDPARTILGTEATEDKVRALREEMGLNRPLPQRYGQWVGDFLQGDMGMSYSYQIPVSELIGNKIPITIILTILSLVFILLFSIPISLVCVRYENGWFDKCMLILNQIMMSLPPFFMGIIFTVLFGLTFQLFIPGEFVNYTENITGFLNYLIFPAIAIALPKTAMTVKMLRNSLLSQMRQDYVRTALVRGNSPWRVLLWHVLPNGMLPVVTFLGMTVADILANSIIIEQVFGIPGIGRILVSSISKRDYPVVEAVIVLVAIVILTMNVLVDLFYRKLDKRIEL